MVMMKVHVKFHGAEKGKTTNPVYTTEAKYKLPLGQPDQVVHIHTILVKAVSDNAYFAVFKFIIITLDNLCNNIDFSWNSQGQKIKLQIYSLRS